MKPEPFWLALTATMTALCWIPYILNTLGVPYARTVIWTVRT